MQQFSGFLSVDLKLNKYVVNLICTKKADD
jgi:hypothetical protein